MMVLRSRLLLRSESVMRILGVEIGIVFVVFVNLSPSDLRRLLQPRHSRRWWSGWSLLPPH